MNELEITQRDAFGFWRKLWIDGRPIKVMRAIRSMEGGEAECTLADDGKIILQLEPGEACPLMVKAVKAISIKSAEGYYHA